MWQPLVAHPQGPNTIARPWVRTPLPSPWGVRAIFLDAIRVVIALLLTLKCNQLSPQVASNVLSYHFLSPQSGPNIIAHPRVGICCCLSRRSSTIAHPLGKQVILIIGFE